MDKTEHNSEMQRKLRIYYEESHPDGQADFNLLMLHGKGQSCNIWSLNGVMDSLASHGLRAVAIDLPGAGRSEVIGESAPPPTRERYPLLIQSILRQFDLSDTILVANDYSATYVLDYLSQDGADVGGCVLCSPDLTEVADVTLGTLSDVPMLVLSGKDNCQMMLGTDSLRHLGSSSEASDSSEPWIAQRPKEFVEKILLFLRRLQTTDV